MTRSIERRLPKYILICFSCIASNTLSAQSIDSFDASGRLSPSAESFSMTQYGQVSPSLYTRAMSFSLPIFNYRDPYFSIPISLEYGFDGYRPDKHSGVVGYGWSLNCGGVITREVRGFPDEGFVFQDQTRLGGDNYMAVDSYTTTAGTTSFKDVTYYNGLGYPEQEVMTDWAATGKKLVRPIVYDNMRRADATKYLPYPKTESNGQMDTAAVSKVLDYYQSSSCVVGSDNHPYSTTVFETTPGGRPLTVTREGDSWVGHPSTYSYAMNGTGEGILKFSFTHNSSNPSVTRSGTYSQGTLLRTSFTDEDGRERLTFRDAFGRIICERVVNAGTSGIHADTYYVYDLRDSLVCVIPPEGTKYMKDNSITSFSFSDSFASDHCFLWWRDGFGRPVGTSNPGGGRKNIEYNDRGLVKKTWSAAMSNNSFCRWLYYDSYGRITEDEYEDFDKSKERGGKRNHYYYDYSGSGTDFGTAYAFVADAAAATSDRTTTMLKGFLKHETMTPVPGLDKSYDNTFTRGREYYYDKYGRVIQIVEVDSDGWKARYSTKYDFLGNVTKTVETHTTPGGVSTSLTTTYTRDKRGKVLTCARTIGGTTLATFTYNYNDLGLLGGRTTPSRSVESFTYDLHGWPKSYSASSYSGGTIFSESLRYASPQKSGSFGLWSGMVSEYQSQLYGGSVRTYDYFYDNASRLGNTAHYNGNTLSSTNTEKDITYDLNGNITALKRYGSSLDDNLTYTYSGNRLGSVLDAVGNTTYTYTHDADGNLASDSRKGISVAYNVLGLPRTVTSGTTVLSHYEYLPDGAKLSALAGSGAGYKYRGSFVYSVDSSGNEKLESVACDEGRISVTYNSSGTASYRDDWHVRDYLGNTRLVVNITSASTPPSTGILEKSDYLPFGTRVATSSTPLNRWRQSGKEEQVIGGNDLGVLDFGARHYDPWLARWTTQDPMAIYQHSFSPYSYCYDNPVVIVDRDGNIGEAPWDLLNVAMDAKSLVSNIKNRKVGAALLDAGGLVYDVAAAAMPIFPGGAGTIIKSVRATDAIRIADRAVDVDNTIDVVKAIHGNSKTSSKAQHAYDIINTKTNEVVKTGVSGGAIRADGKSVRAESQVRRWNKESKDGVFQSVITKKIPEGEGARRKILQYERDRAIELRNKGMLRDEKYHKIP